MFQINHLTIFFLLLPVNHTTDDDRFIFCGADFKRRWAKFFYKPFLSHQRTGSQNTQNDQTDTKKRPVPHALLPFHNIQVSGKRLFQTYLPHIIYICFSINQDLYPADRASFYNCIHDCIDRKLRIHHIRCVQEPLIQVHITDMILYRYTQHLCLCRDHCRLVVR